ncbi:recombinase family protein [Camelimonas fluminis]|uniref:recombinase family protein n=1 Tax=Camelimonas fluminis TaxID=1576911 RepID=UPI001FCE6CAC|nr:recombinase family protein [Camelimonas fluminis]
MSRQPDSDAGRVFIGYARVSTRGQDLDQQRAALGGAGCVRIFEEKASGAKRDRPELARMLDHLRAGDVVTITRLDRLARSTGDLLAIAERIKEAGAGLRSLARGFRAILDRGAHQRRPDRGESPRREVRPLPCPVGRADRPCSPAHP